MWRNRIPILFKVYILLLPIALLGQDIPSDKEIIFTDFKFSKDQDSLFFDQTILIKTPVNKSHLIFNFETYNALSQNLTKDAISFLTAVEIDHIQQDIPDNSFYALPIPIGSSEIHISGYYLFDKKEDIIEINQKYIPQLGQMDTRPGALRDYLDFDLPLEVPVQLSIRCNSGYGINGDPISMDNSYSFANYYHGPIYIHALDDFFNSVVQIDDETYHLNIIGPKWQVDPFKFEQIQRLIVWMHEHYGEPQNHEIVLSIADFNQSVFTKNGFKYFNKYLNFQLIEKLSKHWIKSIDFKNPHDYSWFRNGFSRYNQWLFMEEFNVDTHFLFPEQTHPVSRFFDLQDLDFKSILLYEYWMNAIVREDIALDNDIKVFSKLNYTTLTYAKSGMLLKHLDASSPSGSFDTFIRSIIAATRKVDITKSIHREFGPTSKWWNGAIQGEPSYDDYYITKSTVNGDSLSIVMKNSGKGEYPVKVRLTGNLGEKDVWLPSFKGDTTIIVKNEHWHHIELDPNGTLLEINKRNNSHKVDSWTSFQNLGKIRLQPMLSLHHIRKRQVFLFPSFRWNNYDKSIIGLSINNRSFPLVNTSYRIIPELSTSTGKLIGNGGIKTNIYPNKGIFKRIEIAGYFKKNHYDFDLEVKRYSVNVKLFLPKLHTADSRLRFFNLKNVSISAEQPNAINNAQPEDYTVTSLAYHQSNRKAIRPSFWKLESQYSPSFFKLQSDYLFKFNTFTQKKRNSLRFYVGGLFELDKSPEANPYYLIGLSNSNDYLFENLLLGRSDESGIWSRQFFVDDGGFKTQMETPVRDFLIATNVQLNIWRNFGLYMDLGIADGISKPLLWDSGIRLQMIDEFLEVYFPFKSSESNEFKQESYLSSVRFILNMDVDDMISKFRASF